MVGNNFECGIVKFFEPIKTSDTLRREFPIFTYTNDRGMTEHCYSGFGSEDLAVSVIDMGNNNNVDPSKNNLMVVVKGDPKSVFDKCNFIMKEGSLR